MVPRGGAYACHVACMGSSPFYGVVKLFLLLYCDWLCCFRLGPTTLVLRGLHMRFPVKASVTWPGLPQLEHTLKGGVLKRLKCVGNFFHTLLLLLGKTDAVCLLGCGET